jgi:hypothetical protein
MARAYVYSEWIACDDHDHDYDSEEKRTKRMERISDEKENVERKRKETDAAMNGSSRRTSKRRGCREKLETKCRRVQEVRMGARRTVRRVSRRQFL